MTAYRDGKTIEAVNISLSVVTNPATYLVATVSDDGEKNVLIRVDDKNNLAFWMEITIDRQQLIELLHEID